MSLSKHSDDDEKGEIKWDACKVFKSVRHSRCGWATICVDQCEVGSMLRRNGFRGKLSI